MGKALDNIGFKILWKPVTSVTVIIQLQLYSADRIHSGTSSCRDFLMPLYPKNAIFPRKSGNWHTPWKTNMKPKNWSFVDVSPYFLLFQGSIFRFQPLFFKGVWETNPKCQVLIYRTKWFWCFHSFTPGFFFQKDTFLRIIGFFTGFYIHIPGHLLPAGRSTHTGRRLVFAP